MNGHTVVPTDLGTHLDDAITKAIRMFPKFAPGKKGNLYLFTEDQAMAVTQAKAFGDRLMTGGHTP